MKIPAFHPFWPHLFRRPASIKYIISRLYFKNLKLHQKNTWLREASVVQKTYFASESAALLWHSLRK